MRTYITGRPAGVDRSGQVPVDGLRRVGESGGGFPGFPGYNDALVQSCQMALIGTARSFGPNGSVVLPA